MKIFKIINIILIILNSISLILGIFLLGFNLYIENYVLIVKHIFNVLILAVLEVIIIWLIIESKE